MSQCLETAEDNFSFGLTSDGEDVHSTQIGLYLGLQAGLTVCESNKT